MTQEFMSHAFAFWAGFACGVAFVKLALPRLQDKLAALRGKLRDKL